MVKALVVSGYGINCEKEMAQACKLAGAKPTIAHAHDIFNRITKISSYHLLILPGGFTFGDELGAAKAFANRMTYGKDIKDQMLEFVAKGGSILGICNGFQLLVKLGLLPGTDGQAVSLTHNTSCRFENRWVHHKVFPSPCIFTQGIESLYLPVRHAEGKLIFSNPEPHKNLVDNQQVVFRYATSQGTPTDLYPHNPNGSYDAIAGMCDPTGRILGMMAHPEAAVKLTTHPRWTRMLNEARGKNATLPWQGEGLKLFENAINYLEKQS